MNRTLSYAQQRRVTHLEVSVIDYQRALVTATGHRPADQGQLMSALRKLHDSAVEIANTPSDVKPKPITG